MKHKAIRASSSDVQGPTVLDHEIYELITHIRYSEDTIPDLIEFVKERDRILIKEALREYRRIHEE